MSIKILFVEDDEQLQRMLQLVAEEDGYHIKIVSSAETALDFMTREDFDIAVIDINLPGMSGLDLLPNLLRLRPQLIPIVMTGDATIDNAITSMKRGATDFIVKPFSLAALAGILEVASERVGRKALSASSGGMASIPVVADSPLMKKLLAQVAAIAGYNTTVLATGETGTGKELVARLIHEKSPRSKRPLVALNCAAIPENLLEDELFGHVKGAFTGAQNAREGRFEQADGGTLFLDEIGDMSLPLQSKLLRVLQEREFERLGSSRTIKVDVRIIAATSADLERRIKEGAFRPDLYYRLNVVHLRVPPLRERPEDVRPLAEHFLSRFCASLGLPSKTIDKVAWAALNSYRWPGNVRQLQNAMERASVLSGASPIITLEDMPEEVQGGAPSGISHLIAQEGKPAHDLDIPEAGVSFDSVVTRVERDLLLGALKRTGGNKQRAAKLLDMKRTTFVEKLKRLQIDEGDEEVEQADAAGNE